MAKKTVYFDSFSTISAFGSNAAIIHYSPTAETDAAITADGLYLGNTREAGFFHAASLRTLGVDFTKTFCEKRTRVIVV
jgi:hypothetical protein